MKAFIFSLIILCSGSMLFAQNLPFVTIQHAGSIGYMSVGLGITSRSQKISNEFLYGFVPKSYGGPLDKLTYKFTYQPFKITLNDKVSWRPFNTVAFAAYNAGSNYSLMPSFKKYEKDYYWWSPALRFHVGASTAFEIKPARYKNSVLLYAEMNTNDRYITTYWDNTSNMKLGDIFFLGLGAKVILAN